jgi:hypothetical protein
MDKEAVFHFTVLSILKSFILLNITNISAESVISLLQGRRANNGTHHHSITSLKTIMFILL